MKKIILIPAAAGILAFGGIVLANTDSNTGANPATTDSQEMNTAPATPQKEASKELIGFEKATSIALGIAEGKVTDVELSEDGGRQEYEIEIHTAEYEYDFDIDAFTGEVLEQDRERLDKGIKGKDAVTQNKANTGQTDNKVGGTAEAPAIPADKAKEIALKETDGGTITDFELDSDDGRSYYEIEIAKGNMEYELEINAADGSIIEFKMDDDR